jgi:hypothetical protein
MMVDLHIRTDFAKNAEQQNAAVTTVTTAAPHQDTLSFCNHNKECNGVRRYERVSKRTGFCYIVSFEVHQSELKLSRSNPM